MTIGFSKSLSNFDQLHPLGQSLIVAAVLTVLSYMLMIPVGIFFGFEVTFMLLEAAATFTTYASIFMSVKQSRWNYPMGILATALYFLLFMSWGLPNMAYFNAFMTVSLIYGWFRWGSDKASIPVTRLQARWIPGYLVLGVLGYILLQLVNVYFGIDTSILDTWIAILSVVAQLLMDNKKIETWIVWAIVNVMTIVISFASGLYLVAFQYIFALGNTVLGWKSWQRTESERKANNGDISIETV